MAARSIGSLAPDYLKRSELVTLRRWLDRLPEPVIWSHRVFVSPRSGCCWIQTCRSKRRTILIDLVRSWRKICGANSGVRALHAAMTHQPELALKFASAFEVRGGEGSVHSNLCVVRLSAPENGTSDYSGQNKVSAARLPLQMQMEISTLPSSRLSILPMCSTCGRLFDAENVCYQAHKRYTDTSPDACDWYWTLGRIAYQRNELDLSLDFSNQAIAVSASAKKGRPIPRAAAALDNIFGARPKDAGAGRSSTPQTSWRGLQDLRFYGW